MSDLQEIQIRCHNVALCPATDGCAVGTLLTGLSGSGGWIQTGAAASGGFAFSGAASGCLAVGLARRSPFRSAPGPALSQEVYTCHLGSESGGDSPPRGSLGRGENRWSTEGSLQARLGEAGREIHCWSYPERELRR